MSGSKHIWFISSSPHLGRLNSENAVNFGIISELLSGALLSSSGSPWQPPSPACWTPPLLPGLPGDMQTAATLLLTASCPFPLCFPFRFRHPRFLLLRRWICREPTWGWCSTSWTWSDLVPGGRHPDHGLCSPTSLLLRPPGHRAAWGEGNDSSWHRLTAPSVRGAGKHCLVVSALQHQPDSCHSEYCPLNTSTGLYGGWKQQMKAGMHKCHTGSLCAWQPIAAIGTGCYEPRCWAQTDPFLYIKCRLETGHQNKLHFYLQQDQKKWSKVRSRLSCLSCRTETQRYLMKRLRYPKSGREKEVCVFKLSLFQRRVIQTGFSQINDC